MITLKEVAAVTGGRCEYAGNPDFTGINTDTRTIKKGELFIALKGENFDGHAYAAKAVENGAAGILVSQKVEVPEGFPVVYVEDTLKGYQDIAHAYRMKFSKLKVVAITGSNGKTSTKDMVSAVLSSQYRVVKTQANFNNEIGLPRTLLSIQPDTEIAVVEMGMRGLGQIKAMCAIARPDVAVISNVGSTHVGELGSLDNIAKAKSEILEDLPSDGFAVLNGDLPRVRAMQKKLHTGVSWFGFKEDDDIRAEQVEITAGGSRFVCKAGEVTEEFFIPQIGEHNVMNALSAIAVGRHFGVKLNNIKEALQGTVLTGSRQELLCFGSYTVINDAYNASPASMEAAFATLARLKQNAKPPCRAIAVVADMLELGDTSAEAHESVGHMAARAKTEILLGYGPETAATIAAAVKEGVPAFHFADRQGAADKLAEILRPGDIVLLKGSHSMQVAGIIDLVFKK
jgi:UDP-N-acetylmuramoyl-tripeptide--D-alanyl-D-alanine ligase